MPLEITEELAQKIRDSHTKGYTRRQTSKNLRVSEKLIKKFSLENQISWKNLRVKNTKKIKKPDVMTQLAAAKLERIAAEKLELSVKLEITHPYDRPVIQRKIDLLSEEMSRLVKQGKRD